MKELDPFVLLAVLQEMLGPLLWLLLAAALLGTAALVALLVRERRVVARRLMWSEAAGVAGGCLALALMVRVASSGFIDVGGPVDWLLIALVFGAGLAGTAVLAYAASGWWAALRRAGS